MVYCASGVRSVFAAKTMSELGYTDVSSMSGGFNKWKDEGRTWSQPRTLTPAQRNRYQRHLLLPEVGETGQLKLLDSKVLLLGAGLSVRGCDHDRPSSFHLLKPPDMEATSV